ncbi:MAG: FHA domain-containing protein [Victivallales bacterium]|nr:FHA domain-containing protein [Victivallales bacterium]
MSQSEDFKGCLLRAYVPGQPSITRRIKVFPCRIGRIDSNDVVLGDSSVSSLHAVLALDDKDNIYLEDQWSTNGIYLDGQRVSQLLIDHPVRLVLGRVTMDLGLTEDDLFVLPPFVPKSGATQPPPEKPKESEKTVFFGENEKPAESASSPVVQSQPKSHSLDIYDDDIVTTSTRGGSKGIICPHCWHRFDVGEFLFIARHQSLIGDSVLGADAPQRFLPSRFTPEGNAIDAAGMSCPDMACPRCHLRIPQAASEMPPLFLSIVGATASGKSYFLTSMTWDLRNTLSRNFAISFTDTDAVNNQILNDFEETIFLSSDPDELVALRKTELQGELYNQVLLDNMLINLPKPFMFTVMPAEHHPRYSEVLEKMSRTLVLYDNAGEHFEPGMDSVDNPTTQHLLRSDTIFFLFDPTKDVRFRKRLRGSEDPQLAAHARVQRQEIILTEMINRIKKYSGMRSGRKTAKTMILMVSKFDVWKQLLDFELPAEPWQWESEYNTNALDVDLIKNVSFAVRQLLDEICPEVVTTAESFAGEVLYLPNSALGHSPEVGENGMVGIRPIDVEPFWVSVPMLYFFYERGFIQSIPEQNREKHKETPCQCTLSGDVFFVKLPARPKPLQIPLSFAGHQLRCPGTDLWFTVPKI